MEQKTGLQFYNAENEYAKVGGAKSSFEAFRICSLGFLFIAAISLVFSKYLYRFYIVPLAFATIIGIFCIKNYITYKRLQDNYRLLFEDIKTNGKKRVGLVRKIGRNFDEGTFYFAVYLDDDKNLRQARLGPLPSSKTFITYPEMILDKDADLPCILYEKDDITLLAAVGYDRDLIEPDIKAKKIKERSAGIRTSGFILGGILWLVGFYLLDSFSEDSVSLSNYMQKAYSYFFNRKEILIFVGLVIFCWFGYVAATLIDNRIHKKDRFLEETMKDIDWITDLKNSLEKNPDIEKYNDTATVMELLPPQARGERVDRNQIKNKWKK